MASQASTAQSLASTNLSATHWTPSLTGSNTFSFIHSHDVSRESPIHSHAATAASETVSQMPTNQSPIGSHVSLSHLTTVSQFLTRATTPAATAAIPTTIHVIGEASIAEFAAHCAAV